MALLSVGLGAVLFAPNSRFIVEFRWIWGEMSDLTRAVADVTYRGVVHVMMNKVKHKVCYMINVANTFHLHIQFSVTTS